MKTCSRTTVSRYPELFSLRDISRNFQKIIERVAVLGAFLTAIPAPINWFVFISNFYSRSSIYVYSTALFVPNMQSNVNTGPFAANWYRGKRGSENLKRISIGRKRYCKSQNRWTEHLDWMIRASTMVTRSDVQCLERNVPQINEPVMKFASRRRGETIEIAGEAGGKVRLVESPAG